MLNISPVEEPKNIFSSLGRWTVLLARSVSVCIKCLANYRTSESSNELGRLLSDLMLVCFNVGIGIHQMKLTAENQARVRFGELILD